MVRVSQRGIRFGLVMAAAMVIAASTAFAMGRRPPATPKAPYSAGEETASLLRGLIENLASSGVGLEQPALVREFYYRRNYQPAWVGSLAAGIRRERVISALKDAGDDGLNPEWYRAGALGLYAETDSALESAKYDILLSDAVLRYAHDLYFGRVAPNAVYADIDLPRSSFDLPGRLNDALVDDRLAPFLEDLVPADPEYRGLKAGLVRYRSLTAQGGWPLLPTGHTIDTNSPAAELLLLRQRLTVEYPDIAAQRS
jgi:murein L,D-transpeptidase YcbB/YkuD